LLEQGYEIQAKAVLTTEEGSKSVEVVYTLDGFQVLQEEGEAELEGRDIHQPEKTVPEEGSPENSRLRFEFRHRIDCESSYYAVYKYLADHEDHSGLGVREQVERMLRAFWFPVVRFDDSNFSSYSKRRTAIAAIADLEGQLALIRDLYGISKNGMPRSMPMMPTQPVAASLLQNVDEMPNPETSNGFPEVTNIQVLGL
jgi:hypothetical protein